MLENSIGTSDYIKIVFPFKLHVSETIGSLVDSALNFPDNLSASYAKALDGGVGCGNEEYLFANININTINKINLEPKSYYISFFDSIK